MKLIFASRALRDVDEILDYIYSKNPDAAKKVSIAIEHTIGLFLTSPYIGAKTDEPDLYRYPLAKYRYTIFYRVDDQKKILQIARVIHGKRVKNLDRLPE